VPNPAELLPKGKIKEAREAYEQAIEHAVRDMVYVASAFYEAGADGINFDTVGASGDPDFKATLLATEILRKSIPTSASRWGWLANSSSGCTANSLTTVLGSQVSILMIRFESLKGWSHPFWPCHYYSDKQIHPMDGCPRSDLYQSLRRGCQDPGPWEHGDGCRGVACV